MAHVVFRIAVFCDTPIVAGVRHTLDWFKQFQDFVIRYAEVFHIFLFED